MTEHRDSAEPQTPPKRRSRMVVVAFLAPGVLVFGALGSWLWVGVTAPAATPELGGLTPSAASRALAASKLADGRAAYRVTHESSAGLIVDQSPKSLVPVARGSAVNVTIAAQPRMLAVPDVGLAELPLAEKTLSADLFEPSLLYAYSKRVPTGLVIEQLPRAGDVAATGSRGTLVVSLGPGAGGESVPSVLGRRLAAAQSLLASATLFADVRVVLAPGVAEGTVLDQAPAAGSIVPVSSRVSVSVASPR